MQRISFVAVLLVASGCGGGGAMTVSVGGHGPLPESHPVSSEQAIRMVIRGALLVDVSDRMAYYGRHVRGAFNVPWDELERRVHEIPDDRPIVIYSRDGSHTDDADHFLRTRGYDVHVLGSFADWGG